MSITIQQALAHVLWIGGAPDSGKTTVAELLAARHGFQLYQYDETDLDHQERLAEIKPEYRVLIAASMDKVWLEPEPEVLAQRALQLFHDRFPLVMEDLLALPKSPKIVAEGFGLLPDLVCPVTTTSQQAVWFVPTGSFKWDSMQRRSKPIFMKETSNPERTKQNVFRRDLLLVKLLKDQARQHGCTLHEVDGSRSPEALTALVEQHFGDLLK
jgi:hypothetical protein